MLLREVELVLKPRNFHTALLVDVAISVPVDRDHEFGVTQARQVKGSGLYAPGTKMFEQHRVMIDASYSISRRCSLRLTFLEA